jgi:DNA polymerase
MNQNNTIRPYFPPESHYNKIAIVGEAPGQSEVEQGIPFVGASGKELDRCLEAAGIERYYSLITNVFLERPPNNDVKYFTVTKNQIPPDYNFPPMTYFGGQVRYIAPQYTDCLKRLHDELIATRPNVVISLGNTATWALCAIGHISKNRGTVIPSTLVPSLKVIPTYHPAAVLRSYDLRPVLIADLMKAHNESTFPEIIYPSRKIYIEPSIPDLYDFEQRFLSNASIIAFDIETTANQFVSCISFAPTKDIALVVPFIDQRKNDYNYWSCSDEILAWEWVNKILSSPIPKVGQNGLYDIQYLKKHHIHINNYLHDTMLFHHALYPEMEKSLGFMGSVYTNEKPWKLMRPKLKDDMKRDD